MYIDEAYDCAVLMLSMLVKHMVVLC